MAYQDLPGSAELPWESGRPTAGDGNCPKRGKVLSYRGRCHICGYPLGRKSYVVFTETGRHYQFPGPLFAGTAQMHRSCALYSCQVCPLLRHKTSRRKRQTRAVRAAGIKMAPLTRGEACVAEFNKSGVFYPPLTEWIGQRAQTTPTNVGVGCFDLGEVLPINEAAPNYAAAVQADAELNFTDHPRAYWTDSPDDAQLLDAELEAVSLDVRTALTPRAFSPPPRVMVGGYAYRMVLFEDD